MGLILSIETATPVCSVALHENGVLIGSHDIHVDRSHSEKLAVMIKNLLDNCNKKKHDLSAVAISKGPGSYTGLRIGASTAKGICYGLNIPLIGINSLEAMANQVVGSNTEKYYLCPMFDARRMEVYALLADHKLNIIEPTHSLIIDKEALTIHLKKSRILFFGNGMNKSRGILGMSKNAIFLEDILPTASSVGNLASQKYKNEDFENTETFEPFYLKDFIATVPRKLI